MAVWREPPFFTSEERAAFALVDAVTHASEANPPDRAWQASAVILSPVQLGAIVALATTINAWNAVGVTTRAWMPEA